MLFLSYFQWFLTIFSIFSNILTYCGHFDKKKGLNVFKDISIGIFNDNSDASYEHETIFQDLEHLTIFRTWIIAKFSIIFIADKYLVILHFVLYESSFVCYNHCENVLAISQVANHTKFEINFWKNWFTLNLRLIPQYVTSHPSSFFRLKGRLNVNKMDIILRASQFFMNTFFEL